MKKTVSLLLAVLLAAGCLAGALADEEKVDLTPIRNSEYVEIDVDEDGDAYVEMKEDMISTESCSITHTHESDELYSYFWYDFIIPDYNGTDPYPVMRIWFSVVTADQYYDFESFTITINGKNYTFTDVSNQNWYKITSTNEYRQDLLLVFGGESIDFIIGMLDLSDTFESLEDVLAATIPIVLHGKEDIAGELHGGFILEFMLFESLFSSCNAINTLANFPGTPLAVD